VNSLSAAVTASTISRARERAIFAQHANEALLAEFVEVGLLASVTPSLLSTSKSPEPRLLLLRVGGDGNDAEHGPPPSSIGLPGGAQQDGRIVACIGKRKIREAASRTLKKNVIKRLLGQVAQVLC